MPRRGSASTITVLLATALLLSVAACGTAPRPAAAPPSMSAPALPTSVDPSPAPAALTSAPPVSTRPATPTAAPASARRSTAPPTASNRASRLRTLPKSTTQVVIVHANGFDTSVATLEAYHRKNGVWAAAFPPMAARIGANGFADNKREGDRATPTGVYAIDGTMYGVAASPGVRYAYHVLQQNDYWNTNPDSPGYNTFQHGPDPGGTSEAMWTISPQYTHLAVIRYNMPAVSGRGSGIFLHQFGTGATLGCVSLSRSNLVSVLRWLDPRAAPRIVLAPSSVLGRY